MRDCPDVAADAICSLQVVAIGDPDNVAPRGTATQSSSYPWGGAASNGIDGITNGMWDGGSVTHTADGDPAPWWQVELDATYWIDRIVLWNRTDACCMLRLSNFRVRVLAEDGSEVYWEDFFTDLSFPDTTVEGFEIPLGGIEGRTVRIEVLGNSAEGTMYLILAEVQVFKVSEGPVAPNAPRNLTAAGGLGKVDLAWEAHEGSPTFTSSSPISNAQAEIMILGSCGPCVRGASCAASKIGKR